MPSKKWFDGLVMYIMESIFVEGASREIILDFIFDRGEKELIGYGMMDVFSEVSKSLTRLTKKGFLTSVKKPKKDGKICLFYQNSKIKEKATVEKTIEK